jgi:glutamine amidotransferase
MCELFAMSALQPAEVSFSLEEFSQHGGLSGPHKDGWGIAFYQNRDALIIREPLPAASSAYVRFIESTPIRSRLVLSHIRRATQGRGKPRKHTALCAGTRRTPPRLCS